MTNNRRDQLSVLARGRGLVSGGVELECIPDYRHSCSLSGDVFLASSPSNKCCRVKQLYKLTLPKTFVTSRGEMLLFTAPEDMVIGRGLQCHSSMEISKVAVKQIKTTTRLCETTKNYQDTQNKSTDVKPGRFISDYVEKLRSVQPMVDEEVANPSPDVPMTSVSDSGIESSVSHPTTISGRTSSLSNRTDSSYNIVIPAADTTIKHGETTNDNTESTTMEQFTDDDKVSKGGTVTNSSELTDIIFSIPAASNKSNSNKNKINSNKKTTKKASKKKSTLKNGSDGGIDHEQKKSLPNKSHCVSGKRKVKKKSKTTKVSEPSLSSNTSLSETINGQTELHHTIVGDGIGTIGTTDSIGTTGTDGTGMTTSNADSTGTDPTSKDPANQVGKVDKRKALMEARANERRLIIEKKRQELEEMKLSKQLEEEKNKALKEQLNKERKQESEPTCMKNSSEQEGIKDSTDENDKQQKSEEELQQCEVSPASTTNILTLREALRHSRDSQQKTQMILTDHKQNEPITSSSITTGDTDITATTDNDKRLLPKPPVKAEVEKKELDYKTQLEQLLNDRHISRPTSHYFSYFSYLPKKKTNAGAKENRRTAKRKK